MTSGSAISEQTEAADARWWRRAILPAVDALLLVIHISFLMAYFEPAVSPPDANGHSAQARLIANEQRSWFATDGTSTTGPPAAWTRSGRRHQSRIRHSYGRSAAPTGRMDAGRSLTW